MSSKSLFITSLLFTLLSTHIFAESIHFKNLSGSWHLRVLDGKEVRKARAILEFDEGSMKIAGFDGCNSISGLLQEDPTTHNYHTKLTSTRMVCRGSIHRYVSQNLHQTLESRFIIKKETKYGIKGITIKSNKHELFFKKMGKDSWF